MPDEYLKQTLKTDLCLSFAESFSARSVDNFFLFLGRPSPWTTPYDDNNPPPTTDTLAADLEAWRNITALAKINKSNVVVGTARYDWAYNTVFNAFDDIVDLYEEGNEKQFYCLTDEYNVYKCLSNNYGVPSTIKPTAITSEEQITEDGYVWKFMFKIREELYDFLTDEFLPIEKLENILFTDERTLQNNVIIGATPGSIDAIVLYQFGSAYPLAVTSDLDNTEQRHRITEVLSDNVFTVYPAADLDRTNDIYNDYYELYIAEGTGAGSKSVITDYEVSEEDGTITITSADKLLVDSTSVYRIYPTIEIVGDGTNASIKPTMNSDKVITGFSILNGGRNYHYASIDVKRKNPSYSNKTLARAVLSPLSGHGYDAIKELGSSMVMIYVPLRNAEKITDPDTKTILYNDYRQIGIMKNAYENTPDDLVLLSSGETEKTFLEVENINSKSLIYITSSDDVVDLLTSTGGVTITQGPESNAYQARGTVDSVVEESVETETSYLITVTNTNGRFLPSTSTTYPLVVGDVELSGDITGVSVSNLYDNETFLPDNFILGTTTASTAKIVSWTVTPYGLSGKLYFTDLKGKFNPSFYSRDGDGDIVLVRGERFVGYASIDETTGQLEGTSPATVGIIKSIGSVEPELKQFYKVSTTLNLTPSSGILTSTTFENDDSISNSSGVEAKVIYYTFVGDSSAKVEVTGLTGDFNVGNILRVVTGTEVVTNAQISSIQSPEVLPYYGDIIYIQNIIPVVASNDSEEHIKLIVKF